ncbi:hypothetical protein [Xanthobacter sediminis]
MSVITHDFGADKRRTTRRFRKLLSLDALHETNVEANPLPYLERASERIFQLEQALFEAVLASRPAPGETSCGETVTIGAEEYRRLKAAVALIEAAHAQFSADDDSL